MQAKFNFCTNEKLKQTVEVKHLHIFEEPIWKQSQHLGL